MSSSINTNVSALIANTNLAQSQGSLSKSIQRLSSGLKINSGADDPSGLIVSEQLKAEIQGISTAIDNSTQATNVISTADAALAEVSNLLVSIKGLVVQAANTGAESSDEIQANQLQVDSAINSITRIANSTSFAGTKLLDGSLGYVTSGVTTSAIHDVNVTNVSFGNQTTMPVNVNVTQSAQRRHFEICRGSGRDGGHHRRQGGEGYAGIQLSRRRNRGPDRECGEPGIGFDGRLGGAHVGDEPGLGGDILKSRVWVDPICLGHRRRQQCGICHAERGRGDPAAGHRAGRGRHDQWCSGNGQWLEPQREQFLSGPLIQPR